MSFGITIEQYTYANEVIYYCQWKEFYDFFVEKENGIETGKRYFYKPEVLKELVDYLECSGNPHLEEWIEYLKEELESPDEMYMVWFG